VIEVVDENMANAARVHAIESGKTYDGRTLVAFGGGGPVHGYRVAEKLGIRRVLVPSGAGVGSAIGFLRAPVGYEVVRSLYQRLGSFDVAAVNALLADMEAEADAVVAAGRFGAPTRRARTAYMRYVGQGHEIAVPLENRALADTDAASMREAFERAYAALFVRSIPGAAIEILSWSVLVTTGSERPEPLPRVAARPAPAPVGTRAVFDGRRGAAQQIPVYDRAGMPPGTRIDGPAIVVEDETSTFVSVRFDVHVDAAGCLVMEQKP
jgi:N-methylhydantoinase A